MAQHTTVEAPRKGKRYTRVDFTALRHLLSGMTLEYISSKLYSEMDLYQRGLEGEAAVNAWLKELLEILIERARRANPLLATHLENARRTNRWSSQLVAHLVAAGELDYSTPKPDDTLTEWLKPIVANSLKAEGISSPGELKQYITDRGEDWFRAVPRIGAGKARTLVAWLRKNEASMGVLVIPPRAVERNDLEELAPYSLPIPLERVRCIGAGLDGSTGVNRNTAYCLISAKHDLEAIRAYLMRFRMREPTFRAYQKELERFLLWCVLERKVAMSSALNEDCEAFKAFLERPHAGWTGKRGTRKTSGWRPFALEPMQPKSQRQAIQILRSFFGWLVEVRYLGGNPWVTVTDPVVTEKALELSLDKALPLNLWIHLVQVGGLLDKVCEQEEARVAGQAVPGMLMARAATTTRAQYRLTRAAILLIGLTGIRREEAANAARNRLRSVMDGPLDSKVLWEVTVLGKRNKERMVFMPERVIQALREHWIDRGHDFETSSEMALLSPVAIPGNPTGLAKHVAADKQSLTGNGFSPDGLYKLIKTNLERMAADQSLELSEEERGILRRAAPHALRHTYATQAARTMPLDVLQRLLGHSSLQTTSIYVRAERSRTIGEASKNMEHLGLS